MDELTFLLILAGVGVLLLVAMFTYYKHHKRINDEINNFNHHVNTIDDVLLDESSSDDAFHHDLPSSFSASRNENFDIDDFNLGHESLNDKEQKTALNAEPQETSQQPANERELVDGVYINTKRVINNVSGHSQSEVVATQQSKSVSSFAPLPNNNELISESDEHLTERPPSVRQEARQPNQKTTTTRVVEKTIPVDSSAEQTIKIVYDSVPEGVDELIISHTILSKGEFFTGEQLFHALDSAGLSYGEMNIYHYPGDEATDSFALFSVANVVEPGTFNPQEPETLKTPGISMFMRLPTRMDSYKAYEKFIHVAQTIAAELGGELCDETRSQLTQQAITYKKEQIRKLNFEMAKADKLSGIKR